MKKYLGYAALALLTAAPAGLLAQTDPMTPDMVARYERVRPNADYVRREVMIPMRDGKRLYTVIVMRKGTRAGPILLTRTPYDAAKTTWRNPSQKIEEILPVMDAEFVNDGYIRVYQDVRGEHRSEGEYVMTRPLRGPLNPTAVDHSTDAYDTIDWLVKNVAETNGRVAITGSSYPGFTSLMALIDPHPALKAAVPQSPMVDGWMGDDWFHNGAFRQTNYDYLSGQTAREGGGPVPYGAGDDYSLFLDAGSSGDFARAYGLDAFPFTRKIIEHPAYDRFWQEQALDKLLAKRKLTVPTMLVVGQWDQEDSYGAPAVYRALAPQVAPGSDMLHLVIGPWRHSGVNYEGRSLGALDFEGDTALQFRRDIMKPFLDRYLKDGAPQGTTPPVVTYATGINRWESSAAWPAGSARQPFYLQEGFGLGDRPGATGKDSYVSDPAHPVPFVARPVHMRDSDVWRTWLVADQRFADGRSDVLTYTSAPLTAPVHLAGAPQVDLFAATTGTDSDWVVKLIDVYPAELSASPKLAGYELPIGVEIFRGRYVHGFPTPGALTPGKATEFKWSLPNVNHVFRPGHRIMVQVQSSLFPLYDRNPQTYVPNIFNARPGDYRTATQSVFHGPGHASAVWLPVVP
ncbi:MAG TPA: CocE/NonD family hydrolase [Allosphingosinicella sp.]|jgi:putative CocE/NonD family hydrolase